MRKMAFACLVIFFVTIVYPILAEQNQKQSPPKLNCQKMVFEYINALENKDYQTFCQLTGKEYSKEDESDFKTQLDALEAEGKLAPFFAQVRLFPEIGELPDWVTEVDINCYYIEGNKEIALEADFTFNEGVWIISPPEPFKEKEIEKEDIVDSISQSPPEGQKTLDLGLNELKKNFILALKKKDWDAVDQYIHYFTTLPEEKENHFIKLSEQIELLEQIPSIGAVPAPARRVFLQIMGILEGKSIGARIVFHWDENKLIIYECNVFIREI